MTVSSLHLGLMNLCWWAVFMDRRHWCSAASWHWRTGHHFQNGCRSTTVDWIQNSGRATYWTVTHKQGDVRISAASSTQLLTFSNSLLIQPLTVNSRQVWSGGWNDDQRQTSSKTSRVYSGRLQRASAWLTVSNCDAVNVRFAVDNHSVIRLELSCWPSGRICMNCDSDATITRSVSSRSCSYGRVETIT